jgi:hypothetical protein
MPIQNNTIQQTTQILVWKITETYQELFDSVTVNPQTNSAQ